MVMKYIKGRHAPRGRALLIPHELGTRRVDYRVLTVDAFLGGATLRTKAGIYVPNEMSRQNVMRHLRVVSDFYDTDLIRMGGADFIHPSEENYTEDVRGYRERVRAFRTPLKLLAMSRTPGPEDWAEYVRGIFRYMCSGDRRPEPAKERRAVSDIALMVDNLPASERNLVRQFLDHYDSPDGFVRFLSMRQCSALLDENYEEAVRQMDLLDEKLRELRNQGRLQPV